MKISAIIPAAGSGSRYDSNQNKLLEDLNGELVLIRTLKTIDKIDNLQEIVICTSIDIIEIIENQIAKNKFKNEIKIILGGKTRQESVYNGLKVCDNPDLVLIHDGARPLIELNIIDNAIKTAIDKGAAIVAVPVKDTIKIADKSGKIVSTPDRNTLWSVQTPQIFKYNQILDAHEQFKDIPVTDDSMLAEKAGIDVFISMGSYKNIKITTKEDIEFAKSLI